jgi:cation/acetate symporter
MLTGTGITFAPLLLGDALPMVLTLFPVTSSAFIGAPLVMIVMVLVSRLTAPPSEKMRHFLAHDVHDCR